MLSSVQNRGAMRKCEVPEVAPVIRHADKRVICSQSFHFCMCSSSSYYDPPREVGRGVTPCTVHKVNLGGCIPHICYLNNTRNAWNMSDPVILMTEGSNCAEHSSSEPLFSLPSWLRTLDVIVDRRNISTSQWIASWVCSIRR